MKKFNQKSINRIVFQKLLESTNQIFQELLNEDDWWRDPQFNAPVPKEREIDPSRGIIPSIDDVNPPKPNQKRQAAPPPTRNPKPNKPIGLGQNITDEEPGNPDKEWEKTFIRDNWYQVWKDFWERQYGKGKLLKEMNEEFERIIKDMNHIYRKARGPNGSKETISESWKKSTEYFFKYFNNRPILA